MIDLRWTELSFGISLIFNLLLFTFIFLYYGKCVDHPNWQKRKPYNGLMFLALCLIIFTTPLNTDDWFHYQEAVWKYGDNMEPVYGYIIQFVNRNYFLFRIIVWGTAFMFTCFTFRRFELNINVAVYFLIAIFLMKFNYARASLAMSSYFLGLSFLVKPLKKHRVLGYFLTCLFFFGAYSFHHSILPIVALSLIAFFPIENPFVLIPAIIVVPIAASYVIENGFFLDQFSMEEDILRRFSIYEQREDEGGSTIWGIIREVLVYGGFFIPIIFDTILLITKKKLIDDYIVRVFRIMLAILFLAASFLFMGFESILFSYRYLFMTFIPITIISVYLYRNKIMTKWMFYSIVIWGITSNAFHYLYGLYKCI